MSKLIHDAQGSRTYKTGVERGVLFVMKDDGSYNKGVAHNGLINFNHSPEGAEANDFYADNMKYLSIRSAENFKASMTCYSTPKEFDACDGTLSIVPGVKIRGQVRKSFGFAYISKLGNDVMGDDYAEILHLVYGCSVNPSEEEHNTVNDSPEPGELSFDIDSVPIKVEGYKPISNIDIYSNEVTKEQWDKLIDMVYGCDATPATYKLTEDVAIVTGKDYYTRSGSEGSYVYTKVENPQVSDIGTYYELVTPAKEDSDPTLPLPADIFKMFPQTQG